IQPIYLQVLRKIHNGLAGSSAVWVVTGSLGMALQGMPVTVNDIDIQTDRSGAYEIERRFAPFVTRKVTFSEAETIRSHFGSLTIDGIRVEIMGDIQKRLEDGSWEEPVDPAPFRRYGKGTECASRSSPWSTNTGLICVWAAGRRRKIGSASC